VKSCPYCGYSNYDQARICRKCDGPFVVSDTTVSEAPTHRVNPRLAHAIRNYALAMVVVGLLMRVYWGGYGPWPTIDLPILASIRVYAEPILILGGVAIYLLGWVAILI
jgi:hypothetical protein